jgi:hypothetical protein
MLCMLPPPPLLSMQIGYNGLERQSDGLNRNSGNQKRNKKLERKSDDSADRQKKTARWKWGSESPDGN